MQRSPRIAATRCQTAFSQPSMVSLRPEKKQKFARKLQTVGRTAKRSRASTCTCPSRGTPHTTGSEVNTVVRWYGVERQRRFSAGGAEGPRHVALGGRSTKQPHAVVAQWATTCSVRNCQTTALRFVIRTPRCERRAIKTRAAFVVTNAYLGFLATTRTLRLRPLVVRRLSSSHRPRSRCRSRQAGEA